MSPTSTSGQSLYAQAERALSEVRPTDAVELLRTALAQQPQNTMCMDLLAQAYLQCGQSSDALAILKQSAGVAPGVNPTKWMLMGQLQGGKVALQCFQQGITLLTAQQAQARDRLSRPFVAASGDTATKDSLNEELVSSARAIAAAYCSMVEVYTTDLCDSKGAEQKCEQLLAKALEAAPDDDPEPHRAITNLRLIQGRADEARASLRQCLGLLGRLYSAVMDNEDLGVHGLDDDDDDEDDSKDNDDGDDDDPDEFEGDSLIDSCLTAYNDADGGARANKDERATALAEGALPSYDARMEVVKMCVELQEYRTGAELIEKLLMEDDSMVETWYFAGLTYLHLHAYTTAHHYLTQCAKRLTKEDPPQPELSHEVDTLLSQLAEVRAQKKASSPASVSKSNKKKKKGGGGGGAMDMAD